MVYQKISLVLYSKYNKMRSLFFLFLIFMVTMSSCAVKKKFTTKKTHMWENRMVTKKEYDSLLRDHTYKFVMNYEQKD